MIIDNNAIFSGSISGNTVTGQTVTGTNTTVTSTNVYDLQHAVDIGKGQGLVVPVEVTTAFSGGTSVTVEFVNADDAAISVNVTVLSSTGPIPIASLPLGARFMLEVGRVDPFANRRYVAVQYVLSGAVAAGAAFAALQPNTGVADVPEYYASGFSVL